MMLSRSMSVGSFRSVVSAGLLVCGAACAAPNAMTVVNASAARRQIEVRTNAEIRSGQCTAEHEAEMSRVLRKLTRTFTQPTEYAGFREVGQQIVVARDSGVTIDLNAGSGGEYHVFAIGYAPLDLSAEDEQGNTIQTRSNRAHIAGVTGEPPASLQLVNAKGDYLITLKGRGCTALAAFKRVY